MIKVFREISDFKWQNKDSNCFHESLGYVPTMGALHQGHLSLIEQALNENTQVVTSIFVNPTQFTNSDDFNLYPRPELSDIKLLKSIQKPLWLYLPSVAEIYPDGLSSGKFNFGGIENQMEGKFRPGHFDGVGTVLDKFFKLLQPDRAYFGEKDFQQLQIVKKLVETQNHHVKIVACPIVREPSGLAMSSRNKRLSKDQFKQAALIYQVLQLAKNDFGIKSVPDIVKNVKNMFENHKYLQLEYFTITDEITLTSIKEPERNKKYRAFIAVYAGKVRLIDNIALN